MEGTPFDVSRQEAPVVPTWKLSMAIRVVGAVLLFVAGYIHLTLMVDMFGLSNNAGKLFLLNFIGAVIALVFVLAVSKWYGWALGILVAGGAAFVKLTITHISGLKSFVFSGGFGGGGHTVLPMFGGIKSLSTLSIVIEIAFVLVAIVAIIQLSRRKTP